MNALKVFPSHFRFVTTIAARARQSWKRPWMFLAIVVCGPLTSLAQLLPPDAMLEQVATGFEFTEGPVADGAGGIWFTDVRTSSIMRFDIASGDTEVIEEDTGGANGLLFDPQGHLIAAEGLLQQVTRRDGPQRTVLADSWDDEPFNSPNDLVMDRHGGIYFTDPNYFQNVQDEAVYYLDPTGQLDQVIRDLNHPNGIALSPDGRTLYVAAESDRKINAYDVGDDGAPTNERLFTAANHPDGLTVDRQGNIYAAVAASGNITAWNPNGEQLLTIDIPEQPSNVAFAEDGNTLYITASRSLYRIHLNVGPPLPTEMTPVDPTAVDKIVVPSQFETMEGSHSTGTGSGFPIKSQEIYLASEFGDLPASWITAVAMRPDENALLPRTTEYGDAQYRLSTTSKSPDELTDVFADNVGPDEQIVFDRAPFTISANEPADPDSPGPRAFDYVYPFDTPFFYDPSQGNLLIEFRSESGYLNEGPDFDTHDQSSAIFAPGTDAVEATTRINSLVRQFTIEPVQLQAGDSDQDLDFDQLDLVQVQIAGKYLTGQPATWGQGDWNGAPGGSQGNPPPGDGLFNQLDIVAAQQAGIYLSGPYAAIGASGQRADSQTSIVYDASTGELAVDAPAGVELTSINIDSAAGIFTGTEAANLGGSFDNDADSNIFKATFGGSFGSISFGNVAQAGLPESLLLSDLSVVGSLAGGGGLGDVDLIYVPEPASVVFLAIGVLVCLWPFKRW